MSLFISEVINADGHGRKFQLGNLLIDCRRDIMHGIVQLALMRVHVHGAQDLVGKTHVHDGRWVAFGGRQID